jgi:predicted deacylase
MAASLSKFQVDLTQLAAGFHRHRFQARDVGFDAFIWRGKPGPVLVLNGATHGDEYEGPTLLRQWVESWKPGRLKGTVVMIPVLNEAAFFAGQRCHPSDNGNLARAFPGRARGSATARLAHLFDTQLLAQATHYVDLHSGGSSYELLPWVGYLTRDDQIGQVQRAMAACFDHFWCWAGPFLPGRTLSAAHGRNIPAIYVECRGAGGIESRDLRDLDLGLRQLLRWAGVTRGSRPRLRRQMLRITQDAEEAHLQVHHPAPHDGIFVPVAPLGRTIRRGQAIGRVLALDGKTSSVIKAERNGRIVLVRYQRSVRRGDALLTLAPV